MPEDLKRCSDLQRLASIASVCVWQQFLIRTFEARYKFNYKSVKALTTKMGESNEEGTNLRESWNSHTDLCKAGTAACCMLTGLRLGM